MTESGETRPASAREIGASPLRRVGHKGSSHVSPGNTRASFDAALEAGVDMIEFDVLSERTDGSGRLLLAHDYESLRDDSPLTLEEGLEHLASEAFEGIELDVDIKLPGYGMRVLGALRDAGLIERSLISSTYPEDLDEIRKAEPGVRVGLSVPRARRDYTADLLTAVPALAILTGYRALLPRRMKRDLSSGRFNAVMAHWRVVSRSLVRAVADGGGELYVWTVDDVELMRKLIDMGVDAIITNDPTLFSAV